MSLTVMSRLFIIFLRLAADAHVQNPRVRHPEIMTPRELVAVSRDRVLCIANVINR